VYVAFAGVIKVSAEAQLNVTGRPAGNETVGATGGVIVITYCAFNGLLQTSVPI
jgi:hypothetical protein